MPVYECKQAGVWRLYRFWMVQGQHLLGRLRGNVTLDDWLREQKFICMVNWAREKFNHIVNGVLPLNYAHIR